MGIVRPMGMTRFLRLTLLTCSLVLVCACSAQQPGPGDSKASSATGPDGDCLMPIEFSSRTYTMLLGPEVGTVPPGRPLGTGQFAPCDDGGGSDAGSREVYSLPNVPTEQAVVLVGARDRGTVYLSAEPPATAWNADLLALMNAWSVQPPKP